jgi:cupin fold WbuC family metalloprotein
MNNSSVQFLYAQSVNENIIAELANMPFSDKGIRRICLHKSEDAPLHVMLVQSIEGSRFPVHYHKDSDEVTLIIEGRMELFCLTYGSNSTPTRKILGFGQNDERAVFIPKLQPHATRPLDGNCTYLEVKLGPFRRESLVIV